MRDLSSKRGRAFALGDVLILAGIGLLTYGTWRIFSPAAFIVLGSLFLVAGLAMSMAANRP